MPIERKNFEVKIENFEKINPEIGRAKVYVMYPGKNRNGSRMTKEVVDAAIPTIYNIPIVGEYKKEKGDFGTHGGKIELSDDDIEFINTTVPIGVVPTECNPRYEKVLEKDGFTEHEYLVVDGYFWYKRYPECERVFDGKNNQSMEIGVNKGSYNEEEDCYDIEDFYFSCLCVLGEDIEPCFEGASVKPYTYALDKDEFKMQFSAMLDELKSVFEVENNTSEVEDTTNADEEESNENTEETDNTEMEESSEEETESTEMPEEESTEEVPTENSECETPAEEPVDYEKLYNEVLIELGKYKETISEKETEITSLQEEFNKLNNEVRELRQYRIDIEREKKQEKVNEMFARFSGKVEYIDLLDKALDMELEDLEKELYFRLGKKQFTSDVSRSLMGFADIDDEEKDKKGDKPYSYILKKHAKK